MVRPTLSTLTVFFDHTGDLDYLGHIHDGQPRVKNHYRYEKLEKRGIKAPKLCLLGRRDEYEELEERAVKGIKASLAATRTPMTEEERAEIPNEKHQGMTARERCLGSARCGGPHLYGRDRQGGEKRTVFPGTGKRL
ncbi:hypothetical protein TWF506_009909 [Arthrobotrys conoides]|uniref:Uncharacterized protein n=1 Tax=Arthrobotrys conoides TaxID=74498 RepID=A0AAN8N7K9_9PEZI